MKNNLRIFQFKIFIIYFISAQTFAEYTLYELSRNDPTSYSNPEKIVVTNISLDWDVDFVNRIISGHVILTITKKDTDAQCIYLDVKDLNISKIVDCSTHDKLHYEISDPYKQFGSRLSVHVPNRSITSKLKIYYKTSSNASGLQWLPPELTTGKKLPYLFSQFEAIHARSALPCQDTPSVKCPYSAKVWSPTNFTVVMSALRRKTKTIGDLKYTSFVQPIPVPVYLIALAVGALESRVIGPRSRVWSEKELVDDCAFEFNGTETQLKAAESICGPYEWKVYDLLILPPSFAFGGMENPCLTFVTPAIITGDRSLAYIVAHEMSHSWTGNLVTITNFEHFWLNEGITVYIERRVRGRTVSRAAEDFDAIQGLDDLSKQVTLMGSDNPLTKMILDLKHPQLIFPDDTFNCLPYEKGQTFIRYLESIVGGPCKFEPFIRAYIKKFKYKSLNSYDFQRFFESYFEKTPAIKEIFWYLWFYGPGMPPIIPEYNYTLADPCDELIDRIIKTDETLTLNVNETVKKNFTVDQQIYFLQKLLDVNTVSISRLEELDRLFKFSEVSKNAEIKYRWLRIGLKAHWMKVVNTVLEWVNVIGRVKYVVPLYRELYAWPEVRQRSIDNFYANKKDMMYVAVAAVAEELHVQP